MAVRVTHRRAARTRRVTVDNAVMHLLLGNSVVSAALNVLTADRLLRRYGPPWAATTTPRPYGLTR